MTSNRVLTFPLAAALCATLGSGAAHSGSETHTFPAGLRTLDITTTISQVRLRTGGSQITVTGTQKVEDSMCGVSFGETDATVTFGPRGTARMQRACEMDFDITVPSGVHVTLTLGTGHLDVQHDGGVDATIATGTVQGTVGAASNLKISNGEVQLLQLQHPLELTIAKGAADLGWTTAPSGTILVNIADGDLRIDLPDDAPVDARIPPNVELPQPQKTTAPTKLLVGKTTGVVLLQ